MSVLMIDQDDQEQPKAQPRIWNLQQWLFLSSGMITLPTVFWPIGDLMYHGVFTFPRPWFVLLFTCLTAWATAVSRIGLAREHQAIIRNQKSINDWLEHLAIGIDTYGDAREAQGHHTASTIRAASNGHGGRPLHVVDMD